MVFPLSQDAVLFFYDTETTGLPLYDRASEDPRQPKIIQLTALQTDWKGNKLSSLDCLLRWPGVSIDEDARRAHGISAEKLEKYGVDPNDAMHLFMSMWRRSTLRVGHNEPYDARLVRIHQKQRPDIWTEMECDLWKAAPAFCTQKFSKPLLKLPPTERMKQTNFRNSYKAPNLREAYFWATGKELTGAHNAMYDVLAVKAVFQALEREAGKAPAEAPAQVEDKAPVDPYPPRQDGPPKGSNPAPSSEAYDW